MDLPKPDLVAALPASLGDLLTSLLMNQSEYFRALFESNQISGQMLMMTFIIFLLCFFYGAIMGVPGGMRQGLASAVKVPLLFLFSVVVSFPALFVISSLIGSKLELAKSLAIILFALSINAILLASFATIAIFFAITGSSYHFMKLLHVAIFAFSGIWGMAMLWKGLAMMCVKSNLYPTAGLTVMLIWIFVYAFVGAQMAWTLRPFIGDPSLPFELLRKRKPGINFYSTILGSLAEIRGQREMQTQSDIAYEGNAKKEC